MQIDDERYNKLCKLENLSLSWNRILTARNNLNYKNYYRRLFTVYQSNIDENLENLSNRLKQHIYHPSSAMKFFMPKGNGLLRPFTFIELEDLIVYQAFANVLLPDFSKKRKSFEHKTVFSNILCDDINNDIFLFKKWNIGYMEYKKNIAKNFESGFVYTAHFDLAAFYDTIDHNSLACAVARDIDTPFFNLLKECLLKWSNTETQANYREIHHSIPQGSLASTVFAELFLLPLDEKLVEHKVVYSRYVDDIVIQGQTELEVKKNVALLDKLCKHKGLIPQSGKFKIFKAETSEEAIGKRPSIDATEKKAIFSVKENVLKIFNESVSEESYDSTTVRYILKCYRESDILVTPILKNFEKHYELVEDFCSYLSFFIWEHADDFINKFRQQLINNLIPYDYVEKEIWEIFALMNMIGIKDKELVDLAIQKVKSSSPEIRYGAFFYLSMLNDNRFMSFLQFEKSSLMQLLLVKFITPEIIRTSKFADALKQIKKRSSNVLLPIIQSHIYNLYLTGYVEEDVFKSLKLKKIKPKRLDSFSYYLKNDYNIDVLIDWEKVFGKNYEQLNELIYFISIFKKTDKLSWINLVDTFNDVLIRSLIPNFEKWMPSKKKWPGLYVTKRSKTSPKEYGVIVNELLSKKLIEKIATKLKDIHDRRCSTPVSHSQDYKTMEKSKFLTPSERNKYFGIFKTCLTEIVKIVEQYTKS